MRRLLVSACLYFSSVAQASDLPLVHPPSDFWSHWGDGQAEVNGYRLSQPRYGETRSGEVILIFVTETFTHSQRVKSDGGHADEYPVLKLNDIRDFQTGIYDYNSMSSTFVRLDGRDRIGQPTKVTNSVQEWCGQVWDQWTVNEGLWQQTGHGYFDGEAETNRQTALTADTFFADSLPIAVRGLAGDWLAPGQTVTVQGVPTALHGRLTHQPPTPDTLTVHRAKLPETVIVPAGTYEAEIWTVKRGEAHYATYAVQSQSPHLLLRFTGPDGHNAVLTGSVRMKYWAHKQEGDEALRAKLGLPKR